MTLLKNPILYICLAAIVFILPWAGLGSAKIFEPIALVISIIGLGICIAFKQRHFCLLTLLILELVLSGYLTFIVFFLRFD